MIRTWFKQELVIVYVRVGDRSDMSWPCFTQTCGCPSVCHIPSFIPSPRNGCVLSPLIPHTYKCSAPSRAAQPSASASNSPSSPAQFLGGPVWCLVRVSLGLNVVWAPYGTVGHVRARAMWRSAAHIDDKTWHHVVRAHR